MNPEPTVAIGLGVYTDETTNMLSVRIEVVNKGEIVINEMKVEWVYTYEAPQDITAEFVAEHGADFTQTTGTNVRKANQLGGRYHFNLPKGQEDRPLGVGEKRIYLYPPEWIPAMISIVQSLSPERYHVAITMNGKEEVAIPGSPFGKFIEDRFGDAEGNANLG